nr:ribosomal protein L22 [Pontederia crassipes]
MIKNLSSSREVKILAHQRCNMSVFKVRRVIDQIRGRSYEETLMILELMPYRASYPILKLVYSAAANANHNMGLNEASYPILKLVYSAAANANHNMGLNEADSFISEVKVNKGPIRKKLRPRARGRSYLIKRPACNITIVLKEKSKDQSPI